MEVLCHIHLDHFLIVSWSRWRLLCWCMLIQSSEDICPVLGGGRQI